MKSEIKKLSKILTVVEASEEKRALQIVFLSVVCLQKSFDEVAAYFKVPYCKVRHAVTLMHLELNKRPQFKANMLKVARLYHMENQINHQLHLVA
jgi:hypothetical protein